MREIQAEDPEQVRAFYRRFAQVEAAPVSPLYAEWAQGVADDDDVVELLMQLPHRKRQPNLLFAAARVHGAPLTAWAEVRKYVIQHWRQISQTILNRRTQTNEPGRIAVLNCAFSRIAEQTGKPLALIEVGASAGLTLYPDAWPIRYTRQGAADLRLHPHGQLAAEGELRCELEGVEPPQRLPAVAWRAGIDLNPVNMMDSSDRSWLEALVWPGMEYRLERLTAGARLVQQEPPLLVAGDLNDRLGQVLDRVPHGVAPVVFHSAVLVYLSARQRARFVEQVRSSGANWVSNEGLGVLPDIAAQLPREDSDAEGFILAMDGQAFARTGPHGQYVRALA